MKRAIVTVVAGLVGLALVAGAVGWTGTAMRARAQAPAGDQGGEPAGIPGPYVADSAVVALLDRPDPGGDCKASGPLVFGCLIQALSTSQAHEAPIGPLANPFNLKVAAPIRATIEQDLVGFQKTGIEAGQQIHPAFLTNAGSRMELVGVINRIDRQFIHDLVPGSENHKRCGEVSLIYRFSYSLRGGEAASRLPVTMNVVFPAIPRARPVGARTCQEVAARWLALADRAPGASPQQQLAALTDPATGVVSLLDGRDIERIELNIQAYRISAGADTTDLGSTAEYVIRVFRWNPDQKAFTPSYMTNEIDRARLMGNPRGDANSCDPGVNRPISRARFLRYLLSPVVLSDIDTGTLNIPQEFLACRATSASPGGAARSKNALYWNSGDPAEQLVTDDQIAQALKKAQSPQRQFSFVKSPDDVRLRLNEMSCTGCHQSRAIAGFHFPGADRPGTPVSNAVYLAGSPHFYGDQERRRVILQGLADGKELSRYQLAQSYASRPLNKFKPQLASTQLIGGWGGACLLPAAMASSQRQWDCRPGLQCTELFKSRNAPGMGACTPVNRQEIGDPLQIGAVTTATRGADRYLRMSPVPTGDWNNRATRDTRIPASALPGAPPAGNGYYGAHQEYYAGDPNSTDNAVRRDALTGGFPSGMLRLSECKGLPGEATCGLVASSGFNAYGAHQEYYAGDPNSTDNAVRRDALTGGFPSGMLRLSECKGLPGEATCGLVASSGFNACLDQVKIGKESLKNCFLTKTSYAGMRACDATSPCRDDYICLKPMGYTAANGHEQFEARRKVVRYDPGDYGQQEPDAAWLNRNGGQGDQRGICIPPYFVFQFRSDGHPAPLTATMHGAAGR